MAKVLSYGMVGGGPGSFIGVAHRKAIALSGKANLVAGCFSSKMEKSLKTADELGIAADRTYSDFAEMAKAEAGKLDFVVIATPNNTHYACCKAFIEQGINVMCEKPLCFGIDEAEELVALSKEKNVVFGVMYGYSGNAMTKFAKQLIAEGQIGEIVNVNAEYAQEWLIDQLDPEQSATVKMSVWRTDPKVSGISNCVGDIGTHIENTVAYVTGLHPKRVAARVDYYGQPLDLNANILVEFNNGVSGNFWCSQVATSHRNGLALRIYGTKGMLEWHEENCEYLTFCKKGEAPRIMARNCGYVYGRAAEVARIPSGHPEGFYEMFANIYDSFTSCITKKAAGEELTAADLDFPKAEDGMLGVKYLHAVIESGKNDSKWVEVK
ncbi:MAG: Gfo/Idh/MocA family oxidoreductase [Oscillospiraceae bacterium]|nr:Gfo/Idh/MocA family oxidoreductase [Oscillospiraceae bacterium]